MRNIAGAILASLRRTGEDRAAYFDRRTDRGLSPRRRGWTGTGLSSNARQTNRAGLAEFWPDTPDISVQERAPHRA